MAASASRSRVVHHLANSRSHRVLVALEELGTPYELRVYQRDPVTHLAPPELRAVHPLGKSPVVTDGDLVLAESGAILEYLAETYDTEHRVSPPREDRRARTTPAPPTPAGRPLSPFRHSPILPPLPAPPPQPPPGGRPAAAALAGAVTLRTAPRS